MAFFKDLTRDSTVIMGSRTFDSIGTPLPQRKNIIFTRGGWQPEAMYKNMTIIRGVKECDEIIKHFSGINRPRAFLIGGATMYERYMNNCDLFYVSTISGSYDGDTYFRYDFGFPYWQLLREWTLQAADPKLDVAIFRRLVAYKPTTH